MTRKRHPMRVHFAARALGAFEYSNPLGGATSGVAGGLGLRRSRSGIVSVGMSVVSPFGRAPSRTRIRRAELDPGSTVRVAVCAGPVG